MFIVAAGQLYLLIRDPMRSSSFFHWCPWIRDTSCREPFGEKHTIHKKRQKSKPWNKVSLEGV